MPHNRLRACLEDPRISEHLNPSDVDRILKLHGKTYKWMQHRYDERDGGQRSPLEILMDMHERIFKKKGAPDLSLSLLADFLADVVRDCEKAGCKAHGPIMHRLASLAGYNLAIRVKEINPKDVGLFLKEMGEAANVVTKHLSDGELTDLEVKEIIKECEEAQAHLSGFIQAAKHHLESRK